VIAAFLTAFYSWRLIIMTFHGKPRADKHTMEHVHESPAVMTVPLLLLAVGAVFAGWFFRDQLIGADWQAFWGASIQIASSNHVLATLEDVPGWVSAAPLVVGVIGIATAYLFYMIAPGIPVALAGALPWAYRFLLNKWYFDEIYAALIVRPLGSLANTLWQVGDVTIIDGVPNGLASLTEGGSEQVVKVQNGSIAVYAFAMLIGLVLLVSIFLLFLR